MYYVQADQQDMYSYDDKVIAAQKIASLVEDGFEIDDILWIKGETIEFEVHRTCIVIETPE